MIKSVRMQNFESHEDTTVEFTEGMNLLVGKSNSGKSSVLRALRMVVDNDWNKDMVRAGYEYCRVRVTTGRGWVEAERGEKVNVWRCQEDGGELQEYRKVGTSVPELATKILGMGSRDRGAGIRELPNFQSQLEKHYMLSEIGEKKSTSGLVAVMMDNAIGLGGMEELIKDFSTDMQRDRKWMTASQAEIEAARKCMVDETLFASYGRLVDGIGSSMKELESVEAAMSGAESRMDAMKSLGNGLASARASVSAYPDPEAAAALCAEVERTNALIKLLERADGLEAAVRSASAPLLVDADAVDGKLAKCAAAGSLLALCETGLATERSLAAAITAASIDGDAAARKADEAERLGRRIASAEERLGKAREAWKSRADAVKSGKALSSELDRAEADLEDLKKSLGICPLCGSRLQ